MRAGLAGCVRSAENRMEKWFHPVSSIDSFTVSQPPVRGNKRGERERQAVWTYIKYYTYGIKAFYTRPPKAKPGWKEQKNGDIRKENLLVGSFKKRTGLDKNMSDVYLNLFSLPSSSRVTAAAAADAESKNISLSCDLLSISPRQKGLRCLLLSGHCIHLSPERIIKFASNRFVRFLIIHHLCISYCL